MSANPIQKRNGAYLPHWTKDGATYAVTFRLADSLPASARREIQALRDHAAHLKHDLARRGPGELGGISFMRQIEITRAYVVSNPAKAGLSGWRWVRSISV